MNNLRKKTSVTVILSLLITMFLIGFYIFTNSLGFKELQIIATLIFLDLGLFEPKILFALIEVIGILGFIIFIKILLSGIFAIKLLLSTIFFISISTYGLLCQ